MFWFRCVIQGENFPLQLGDKVDLFGFWTTRYVRADTPSGAELAALELLRADPSLQGAAGDDRRKLAQIHFESIEPVDEPGAPNAGFTFYRMKDE
jgi:hypothetical protein